MCITSVEIPPVENWTVLYSTCLLEISDGHDTIYEEDLAALGITDGTKTGRRWCWQGTSILNVCDVLHRTLKTIRKTCVDRMAAAAVAKKRLKRQLASFGILTCNSYQTAYCFLQDARAEIPRHNGLCDIGRDMSIIEEVDHPDDFPQDVHLYTTGVVLIPPNGCYFEILPRSSIVKLGVSLANGVAVIDPLYRGDVRIALRHHSPDVRLSLPCKIVQAVLRVRYECHMVRTDIVNGTTRGTGAFGSTG
jgi:dUTPase